MAKESKGLRDEAVVTNSSERRGIVTIDAGKQPRSSPARQKSKVLEEQRLATSLAPHSGARPETRAGKK